MIGDTLGRDPSSEISDLHFVRLICFHLFSICKILALINKLGVGESCVVGGLSDIAHFMTMQEGCVLTT